MVSATGSPAFVTLTDVTQVTPANPSQLEYRVFLLPLQRKGWHWICQRSGDESDGSKGLEVEIPGKGGYLRPERATAVFVTTSYGCLSIGFSGDFSQDRSCRKFVITSLLVKLQSSYCLRISMECKCLGEGWW